MDFHQNNDKGNNKIIFSVGGNFTNQSKQIQKFVTDKDEQARIANRLALFSLITAILSLVTTIILAFLK